MKSIHQSFSVPFEYNTHFSQRIFKPDNTLVWELLQKYSRGQVRRMLVIIDQGVSDHHPDLSREVVNYMQQYPELIRLQSVPMVVPGGEPAKNDWNLVNDILNEVNEYGIDRHSYILAIGGGAVLDLVGFAAAIAHRGIRLIRIPTTVLSQNDSGVGVKNSVNFFDKKNFLGTFQPPIAVINDSDFLRTLEYRDWRGGISEAIKVALIKDAPFFERIEQDAPALADRDMEAMDYLIYRCAELHMEHIAGGDPFEMGSSRPLDFGHWAAHKLEQLSQYQIRHGEAVAIGMALDVTYSYLAGYLEKAEWERIMNLFHVLGFDIFAPQLMIDLGAEKPGNPLLNGLEEFREHLGGQLTIMLIDQIGHGFNVHKMDQELIIRSIETLKLQHEARFSLIKE